MEVAKSWVAAINAENEGEIQALAAEDASSVNIDSLMAVTHPIENVEYALASDMPPPGDMAWVIVSGSVDGDAVRHELMIVLDAEEQRWILLQRT